MMMKKLPLVVGISAGFGVGAIVLAGTRTLTTDEAEHEELAAGFNEEEVFLRLLPAGPQSENPDLVPHATSEEAAAIAADFFDRPAPTDAELAAMTPFKGAENVPLSRCDEYIPQAAKDELNVMKSPPDLRMKDEIYGRLNVRRVLDSGKCACAGKVAPFEPVGLVLQEIKSLHGKLDGRVFDPYYNETMRLRRAVERLYGGRF